MIYGPPDNPPEFDEPDELDEPQEQDAPDDRPEDPPMDYNFDPDGR